MARRQRVPRHKEHRRKRNKNPKLSPFQREQRRLKLANQAPTFSTKTGTERDYPVSQRAVIQFLIAKQKSRMELRQRRKKLLEGKKQMNFLGPTDVKDFGLTAGVEESDGGFSTCVSSDNLAMPSQETERPASDLCKVKTGLKNKEQTQKKKASLKEAKKGAVSAPVALNAIAAESLPRPILAFKTREEKNKDGEEKNLTLEAIIARKKERKHRKKADARRQRVQTILRETEKQLLEEVLPTKKGKKRRTGESVAVKDLAFERKLRQMQKEKAASEAAGKRASRCSSKQNDSDRKKKSDKNKVKREKHISFLDGGASGETDAPHYAMRYPKDNKKDHSAPREFYELVDVVRYGERVEAPPVFNALPRHDNSITRLAARLHAPGKDVPKINAAASSRGERLRMLASIGGRGCERRLERLGLHPLGDIASPAADRARTKREEMERLRETVVAAYRRRRREAGGEVQKGVDMHHQFPVFS